MSVVENTIEPIIIPELIIFKSLKAMLEEVRLDIKRNNQKEDTWLWRVFQDLELEGSNYYNEMKNFLLRDANSSRKLNIYIGWNRERNEFPLISIILPGEEPTRKTIGMSEENVFDEVAKTFILVKESVYLCTYSLMVVSDNVNEVILLYNFLRSMIIALHDTLELQDLNLVYLTGQDISQVMELVPNHLYSRVLGLNFQYVVSVPDVLRQRFGTKFNINGQPTLEEPVEKTFDQTLIKKQITFNPAAGIRIE